MELNPAGELATRPDWFYKAVNRAVPLMRKHHGVAETILGIGREIDLGNHEEARRLFDNLDENQLKLIESNPDFKGEKKSSQVKRMLEDNRYPNYLKEIIRGAIGDEL